ncbi:MAG: Fic family protein [Gammaproteobacteria bacterium]|jgi:Fic family protein|uniref:MarR family transcriptional regulator n=1 Tax=Thalassolituus oleivorans TaxID=187493 RepID=UPI00046D64F7|nr:MarR family transcriptional regulator [Thalassolituus oleivorans]
MSRIRNLIGSPFKSTFLTPVRRGLNKEQIKVLNRLLDGGPHGFEDGISAGQYQKVTKVSKATATRHLADLVAKGCVEKMAGGGRSTRHRVIRDKL